MALCSGYCDPYLVEKADAGSNGNVVLPCPYEAQKFVRSQWLALHTTAKKLGVHLRFIRKYENYRPDRRGARSRFGQLRLGFRTSALCLHAEYTRGPQFPAFRVRYGQ